MEIRNGKLLIKDYNRKSFISSKIPSIIKNKQSRRFVYVLPKFVLGDSEKLQIELQELKGSRSVTLKTRL